MNILYCKNSLAGPISGADEIVVTYAIELRATGHSTSVLLVHPPLNGDPQAARLSAAGVPMSSLASSTFSRSLAVGRQIAIRAMRAFSPTSHMIRANSRKVVFDLVQRYHDSCCEYLVRSRPDVVHVVTPDPGAVMLIRAAHTVGIPVVYQEVGIPFHPPGFEEVYERFVSVLPLCSEIAALSPRLAREMGRVLPQISPPQVLPLISQETANGAFETRPSAESTCFGFAARLEHLKGPLRLVEGFAIAHRAQPAVKLKIAGDGSQRQHVTASLRQLGLEEKSHFTGVYTTSRERSEFMHSIDVFVLPSLTEGTPNAIIEAMAHHKPVIATDVGGISDIVTDDVGILVSPSDTKALGAAMTRLVTDPELCKTMGFAARKRYEQLFTARAVLPMLIDFYKRAIDGRQPATNEIKRPQSKHVMHPWSHGQSL